MTPASDSTSSVSIGHWTNQQGTSGCTVILFDRLTVAAVDVRGGAPGTRETDLLGSNNTVRAVDAIVLTGGSAFGLAAADGVMRFLRERNRGYTTGAGPVPIVSAAVIFDLREGQMVLPDADAGYAACLHAMPLPAEFAGRTGGGAGATIRKLWGPKHRLPGGIGISTVQTAYGAVTAVLVLNAAGGPFPAGGDSRFGRHQLLSASASLEQRESTAIGVIIVHSVSDHALLERCAITAHDGLTRSIAPAHTVYDGDVFFAAGIETGLPGPLAFLAIPTAAELAVEQAIAAILALGTA